METLFWYNLHDCRQFDLNRLFWKANTSVTVTFAWRCFLSALTLIWFCVLRVHFAVGSIKSKINPLSKTRKDYDRNLKFGT